MLTFPFENSLLNEALNIVTVTDEGFGRSISSLTVANLGKDVAFTGEKVVIFPKGTSELLYVTLTANMGSSTTMSFSSFETNIDIPEGSVILPYGLLKHKKINTTDLYFHQPIFLNRVTNTNDFLSTYGSNIFGIDSGGILTDGSTQRNFFVARYSSFVAPYACTLKKIKGWVNSTVGANEGAVISIWSSTPNPDSTTNLTIDLVHAFTLTSQNNSFYVFDLEQDTSALADAQLAEGDIIFVSIRRTTGSRLSTADWYAQIGFDVEMIKQPI
tara:strand:- start:170 stop:985 length:816 start_codon:yes stop_codon:yes gene_type:complete